MREKLKKPKVVEHSNNPITAKYLKSVQHLDKDDGFQQTVVKYARGTVNFQPKSVKFKGLRKTLQENYDATKEAATKTAAVEILRPSDAGFIELSKEDSHSKVFKLSQKDIIQHVDINTSKKAIELQLTKFGPYMAQYSRNGRLVIMLLIVYNVQLYCLIA